VLSVRFGEQARDELSDEDEWLITAVVLATKTGWTMEYIDSLDYVTVQRVMTVIRALDEARAGA